MYKHTSHVIPLITQASLFTLRKGLIQSTLSYLTLVAIQVNQYVTITLEIAKPRVGISL